MKRGILVGLLMCSGYACAGDYEDLMRALFRRNFTQALKLIHRGDIDLNQRCEVGGLTPLMAAAGASRLDLVQLLLEQGADPNMTDSNGDTVLFHLDYLKGDELIDLIKLLKKYGLNVNVKNNQGRTIMWLLCSGFYDNLHCFSEVIRLFCNYGVEMIAPDYTGEVLMQFATRSKAKDLVLMSGLFLKAIQENDDAMIKALLTVEPVLACVTYNGKNCLDVAHILYNWRAIAALNAFFTQAIFATAQSL